MKTASAACTCTCHGGTTKIRREAKWRSDRNTVGSDVDGYFPILEDLPPRNEDGVGGMHMYMPWWHYKDQKGGKMAFRSEHGGIGRRRLFPDSGRSAPAQ